MAEAKDKKDEKKEEGPKTSTYVLLDGKRHDGLKAGDEVELTESQAKAFRDKFKPKGGESPVKVPAPVMPPADGSGTFSGAIGPSHVPQDDAAEKQIVDTNVGNHVGIGGKPVPPASASNTSAATGSPLSPDPVKNTTTDFTSPAPAKDEPKKEAPKK